MATDRQEPFGSDKLTKKFKNIVGKIQEWHHMCDIYDAEYFFAWLFGSLFTMLIRESFHKQFKRECGILSTIKSNWRNDEETRRRFMQFCEKL